MIRIGTLACFHSDNFFSFIRDMGIIKTTFITPKHAAVRGQVFREIKLDPEKIEEIGHVKFNYDRFNKEVEDEDTRVLINDEYTVMISSAEQELSLLQPLTAGAGVYRREKTFEPPKGYIRVDRMVQERVGDKVVVEEYPFNHGVWCKKEGTSNATYFYCCVNDRCRKKPTIIELEMLTSISKIKTIIDRHIREVHWTHLIQLEKFDE